MNLARIRNYSLALASVFALGIIGCNSTDHTTGREKTVNPTNPVAPPSNNVANVTHPTQNYRFFEITDNTREIDLSSDEYINYGYMIAKTTPGFNVSRFDKFGLKIESSFTVNGATYYRLSTESDMLSALKGAKRMSGLMYIEPEYLHYATGLAPVIGEVGAEGDEETYVPWDGIFTNKDARSLEMWNLRTTHTTEAWEKYGFGPHRPVVANVDTGIRYLHEDLRNIVKHAYTWYSNGTDLLPNGNPLADPNPQDWLVTQPATIRGTDGASSSHGSHTCGTMAAEGNNGVGVQGICWGVDLISYKGLSNAGSGGSWAVYGSLWHLGRWKKENNYTGTIPVNMSLGSLYAAQFSIDMIEYGLENNIIVIGSSGNSFNGIYSYPGSYTGVVRTGAVDATDRRYNFSNWGPDMSVVAPGVNILSTASTNNTAAGHAGYGQMDGTSMATPHVTGLVGYMLTFAPNLKPDQIKTYLERNADLVGGAKGFTPHYGWGRINVARTVGAVKADADAGRTPASNYVMKPVKIKVGTETEDGGIIPQNDLTVYLYQCNAAGDIQNYVASAFTGKSFVDWDRDPDSKPEDGVAYFNMLKPGYYKAAAYRYVTEFDYATKESTSLLTSGTTATFNVTQSQALPEQVISFKGADAGSLIIQTYPTSDEYDRDSPIFNYNRTPDTMIYFYDSSTAEPVFFLDDIDYDVMSVKNVPPGTYWIGIEPWIYHWTSGSIPVWDILGGPYALWISKAGLNLDIPAPLTYGAAPEANKGSLSQSRASAQLIVFDKVYYCLMADTEQIAYTWERPVPRVDYYRIVVE